MAPQCNEAAASGASWKSMRRAFLLCSLLATCLASTPSLAHRDRGDHGPVVNTGDGPVRGFVDKGVNTFLGIPYAAPPVGENRWRPPQPVERWGHSRDATEFGNSCAQVTTLGAFAGPTSVAEDCLYLNVFTTGHSRSAAKLPVIVWIHGGGNFSGASDGYDGSKLATGGPLGTPTVVVTLNYRLGLLGFLAHPALNAEGHPFGNYAIMDIQAALRWVQRNIEAFGGDPKRVTLGGQSAGANNTMAAMTSPMSAGLFHRAIPQSSPIDSTQWAPLPTALALGTAFAEAAGCRGSDAAAAACLRALSAARILQLQGTPNANGPFGAGTVMVDGVVIPMMAEAAWTSGQFLRVPVLGGSTHDEWTFVTGIGQYFSTPQAPVTAEQYTGTVNFIFSGPAGPGGTPPNYPPGTAAAVLARYPLANYANPGRAYSAALTDSLSVGPCRSRHVMQKLSQWVPVYAYQFNYRGAPYYFPDMPGFEPLAAHTIDIQFIFPGWHGGNLGVNSRPLNAQENALSDQMVAAWTNFARSGNPNGGGNWPWPRYTTQAGAPAVFSQNLPVSSTLTDAQLSANHQCDFWETVLIH
jgi:para-nitrobenzyl esterase